MFNFEKKMKKSKIVEFWKKNEKIKKQAKKDIKTGQNKPKMLKFKISRGYITLFLKTSKKSSLLWKNEKIKNCHFCEKTKKSKNQKLFEKKTKKSKIVWKKNEKIKNCLKKKKKVYFFPKSSLNCLSHFHFRWK